MGKLTVSGHLECEVGGVYHVCYFSSQEISEIIKGKGKENSPMNGQTFPYIAHYLITGDLIYPAHEGENHISSLLEEMGRLDLVQKLFPNQKNAKPNHSDVHRTSGKGLPGNDYSTTLRIKTKEDRWVSKTLSRWLKLPKSENSKSYQVYRPPPQHYKGTTLVVLRSSLHGNTQVRVHGPSTALKSLIPNALTITSQTTHHHLNSHIVPSGSSAHSVVMSLEEQGFVVTVRSSRVEGKTGALITQWVLYRGSNKKLLSSSGTSRRTGSLGKALGTSKKSSHSLSTSRKKISKSGSTLQSNNPFTFGSPVDNGFGITSTGNNFSTNEELKKSQMKRYDLSSSETSSNSSSSLASSPKSNGSSTKKPFHSLSSINKHFIQDQSQTVTENASARLSSKSFVHNLTDGEKDKRNLTKSLTFSHKSFSTDSIAPNPIKKIKKSPSLWNICPKSSVKRVISILF